jgi:CxxC-x17-CxxC domain-containing protein
MSPADAILICRDCGSSFTFPEDERQTFAAQGHYNPPSRCSACRSARKTRQVQSGRSAVAPRFRELRQARTTVICSSCGQPAVVPFAARPGRNVYCSACFERRRGEGGA